MVLHHLPHSLPGRVFGSTLRDDDLHEIGGVVLVEDRPEAVPYERRLVADRHDDRDEDRFLQRRFHSVSSLPTA